MTSVFLRTPLKCWETFWVNTKDIVHAGMSVCVNLGDVIRLQCSEPCV